MVGWEKKKKTRKKEREKKSKEVVCDRWRGRNYSTLVPVAISSCLSFLLPFSAVGKVVIVGVVVVVNPGVYSVSSWRSSSGVNSFLYQ